MVRLGLRFHHHFITFWLEFLLFLPRSIRFWLYIVTMRYYVSFPDPYLKWVVVHLMNAASTFSDAQSEKFTEMRLMALIRAPREVAMRHIRFMWPEITSAELKKSAKVIATLQRVTFRMSKEDQLKLAELVEPFGATDFLPIGITLERERARSLIEPTEPIKAHIHAVRTLSYEDLKQWIASKKKFFLVEVLTRENYALGHIPGAMNIPAEEIDTALNILKKDDCVVLYCRDKNCQLSSRSAEYLIGLGFTDIYHFAGGKLEWAQRGEPLEI